MHSEKDHLKNNIQLKIKFFVEGHPDGSYSLKNSLLISTRH